MLTRDVNPPFPAKPAFEGFGALREVGATAHRELAHLAINSVGFVKLSVSQISA
jgi:hypothetical protein